MKKVSILFLALLLALSMMTACGRDKDKNNSTGQNNAGQNNSQSGMTDQNGTNNNAGGAAGDIANGVGDAAQGLADGVAGLWDGMLDFFGVDRRPNTVEGDDKAFAAYGLDENLIEDYILHSPADENTAEEFFIAKVKDGKMAEVEEILEKRKEAIAANWAENSDAAFDYARQPAIFKSGNYIMLAVHADAENIRTEFERLIGEMEKAE